MSTKIDALPREILEKAIKLRNSTRTIYIELYSCGKPMTADEIAAIVKHARAYVNMRLNQLEDMNYVRHIREGREKLYEVVK